MTTTSTLDEDSDKDLTLSPPTVEWGHFINQLNQDPREDSIPDSGLDTAVMEEVDADMAGDEEIESRGAGAVADVASDMTIADLTWDPKDLYFALDYESSGAPQVPMAASTPVLMPTKEALCPASPNIEGPQREILAPEPAAIGDLVKDYSDIPPVGFSWPELHQVILWI